jgi:hypothetical protein
MLRRLIEWEVGALGLQPHRVPGCRQVAPQPPLPPGVGLAQERLCGPAGTRPGVAPQRSAPAQSRPALPVRSCPARPSRKVLACR